MDTSAGRAGQGQDYRALMACDAGDGWISAAQAQLSAWLREKDLDYDLNTDGRYRRDGQLLVVAHHANSDASSMRMNLVENSSTGTWRTELLLHDRRGHRDWLSLTVANDQGKFVAVPRLADYLMSALPLSDGLIEYSDKARTIGVSGLDSLIDQMCDPDRHGLILAAGTNDRDGIKFDIFRDRVEFWAKQTHGLAQVVVLDPQATRALQTEFGKSHAVPEWAIRTYMPGLDPASTLDARRHRILGTVRLANSNDRRIISLLGQITRAHAATRTESGEVVRVRRTFERIENSSLVRELTTPSLPVSSSSSKTAPARDALREPRPEVAPEQATSGSLAEDVELYLEQIELVKSLFGVQVLNQSSLESIAEMVSARRADMRAIDTAAERMRYLQDRVELLEDELSNAKAALDEGQLDAAEFFQEWSDSQEYANWLQARLASLGDYDTSQVSMPIQTNETPASFADLLSRLKADDSKIIFTGDVDIACGVDAQDTLGLGVQTCWAAILALRDYVSVKLENKYSGSVADYLRRTPAGMHTLPPAKHAASETEKTMNQFGRDRRFPVPVDVSADGSTVMTSHFKLAHLGMVSPRMYYMDDVNRSGRVYIGYIGPHLRNTQTN